jgi:hypothetical protein
VPGVLVEGLIAPVFVFKESPVVPTGDMLKVPPVAPVNVTFWFV